MARLSRFYNQNRHIIWIIIVSAVLVFGIIRILNNIYKNKPIDSSSTNSTTTYNNDNYSIISRTEISEQEVNETTNIVDEFIKFCNNKDISSAYNLLSKDCKETLYPTEEKFSKDYVENIFETYKIYDKKTWITDNDRITYRINITEDILSTGNSQELAIEEYYTLVKEDNQYKLNIHNYVGKEVINKSKTENNITFNVVERYIYMEYEIYKINVNNLSNNKIMIDSKEKTRNVNIIDQNELKYVAFLNEISKNNLIIYPGINKDLKIKFNKSYNPKYLDEYMEFSDIVLDMDNKDNRGKIKIEL